MRRLLVVGAGGHARELLDAVAAVNAVAPAFELVGALDDDPAKLGADIHGVRVIGDTAGDAPFAAQVELALGIGSSAVRARLARRLAERGARFATVVHPRATIGARVELGDGAYVAAGAVLTTDVVVGAHAHVNVAATVSHDCVLGAFSTIGPGSHLAGGVRVGDGCDLGVGVCAIPGVRLGAWSIVGAGTVVTRDVDGDATLVGTPARVIARRPAEWHRSAP